MSGFRITGYKGVHFQFANGWVVSVQWGPGNYCDNQAINHPRKLDPFHENMYVDVPPVYGWACANAEVAAWHIDSHERMIEPLTNQTPDQVLAFMQEVASR